jgi:hypothetical protein
MNNVNKEVVEKIKKLLDRANCDASSETERETAMRMAYSIMAKHNMTMESLSEESNPRTRVRKETHGMAWARQIANSVGQLFFCRYVYSNAYGIGKNGWTVKKINIAEHSFIGKESNAITASELAAYLINSTFREGSRRMKIEGGERPYAWRMDFCKGVEDELIRRCYKLRAEQEAEQPAASTGTSIVLADLYKQEFDANRDWIQNNIGKLGKGGRGSQGIGNAEAYGSGREYGKKLPLSAGLTDSSKSNLRLK